jgi:hypothetical protein
MRIPCLKQSQPQQGGIKKFRPLTQEKKDHRCRNNLCSYCGGQNHFADRCPKRPNRPSFSPRQNVSRVRGAQLIEAHFIEKDNNDQPLEEGEIPATVSYITNNSGPIRFTTIQTVLIQNRAAFHIERTEFYVTSVATHDIIFGTDWLKAHNPELDWTSSRLAFTRCPSSCTQSSSPLVI